MTYVAINVLTVPEGAGATLEERFAGRAGMVEKAPGFVRFELLRPVEGTSDYLVLTHWEDQSAFTAWKESMAFGQGHANAGGGSGPDAPKPAATGSTIWCFEVAQRAEAVGSPEAVGSSG